MKETSKMQLGMVGPGRMGANMVRRLIKSGHQCVVHDRAPQAASTAKKKPSSAGCHVSLQIYFESFFLPAHFHHACGETTPRGRAN